MEPHRCWTLLPAAQTSANPLAFEVAHESPSGWHSADSHFRRMAFLIALPCMPGERKTISPCGDCGSAAGRFRRWLDSRFESRWKANNVKPPAIVDDATFLRRAYLDLGGTIPSVSQTLDFLSDQSTNKREKMVDQLLGDPRSSKNLARVWRRMMVPGNGPESAMATQFLEPWLIEEFAANTHYNELARKVLVVAPPVGAMQTWRRTCFQGNPHRRHRRRRIMHGRWTHARCGCRSVNAVLSRSQFELRQMP